MLDKKSPIQGLARPETGRAFLATRAEAIRAFGVGEGLRSSRWGNWVPAADRKYTKPALIVGASRGTVVTWTGTSALTWQVKRGQWRPGGGRAAARCQHVPPFDGCPLSDVIA